MLEKCGSYWLSHLVPLQGRRAPPACRGTAPALVVPGLTCCAAQVLGISMQNGRLRVRVKSRQRFPVGCCCQASWCLAGGGGGEPQPHGKERASPGFRRTLLMGITSRARIRGSKTSPGHLPIVVLVLRKVWSLVTASVLWGCKSPAAHVVPSVLGH